MQLLSWMLAWGLTGNVLATPYPPARLELEGRLWFPTLTAQARASVAEEPATEVDLKRDLGLNDRPFPEVRLTWRLGRRHRFQATYTDVVYRGDRVVRTTVRFQGRTYDLGTRVRSEFQLRYLRLGWAWQFLDLGEGILQFGPLIDLKGLWVEGSLTAPDIPVPLTASRAWRLGAPTPGAVLDVRPAGWIAVFAEVSGLPGGSWGTFWDLVGGVHLTPFRYLRLSGGYRILHGRVESDPDFVRVTMAGPFLGATLQF